MPVLKAACSRSVCLSVSTTLSQKVVCSRISPPAPTRAAPANMALSKLSGDEQGIVFSKLCNVLEPRLALEQRQQRAAGADAAAAAAAEG